MTAALLNRDAGAPGGTDLMGLRRVWRLMGAQRVDVLRALVFRLLQSFSLGLSFGAVLWVIQDLSAGRALTGAWIWQICGLAALSLLGQIIFSYLSVKDAWQASFETCGAVRLAMLDRLVALPLGFHLTHERGNLVNMMTSDISMLESFLSEGLARFVQAFGLPLAIFFFMLAQDWVLAVAMALTIIIGVPILVVTSGALARLGLARQSRQADASARIVEFVLGQPVLRAFNQMSVGNARFRDAIERFLETSIAMVKGLVLPIMLFVIILMLGIPMTYLAIGWRLDSLAPGTAISALVLSYAMYAPIIGLVSAMETMRLAEASLIRIDAVLSQATLPVSAAPRLPDGFHIAFDDVTFGYGTESKAIDGVSFQVPERSMVAIVGPSGSGKTTLLNLAARFWDTVSGEISIGGVPVTEMTLDSLMDQISIVSQDVALFSGTIWDNIRIGRSAATDEDVISAAKQAQAYEFITALPDGFSTQVGESGARLSGGERQRIAIARALLKDAPIVLLDEATAAIDPISERALQHALSALAADRTVVMVAHKMSLIRNADQILVLNGGRIVERGNHEELIARAGTYARFCERKTQAGGWTLSRQPDQE